MEEKKTGRTNWISLLFVFLVIPLTLFLLRGFTKTGYYVTAVIVMVEIMIPFFISFERRRPQARELVILAVLAAIAVAGRTAFAWINNVSPMAGLIMIAGAAFGAESGFIVGSVGILASNFIFGQTMYTPFQMFAYGMGGFVMGLLCSAGKLKKKKVPMAVAGFLIYFLIVGPLLDSSVYLLSVGEEFFGWGIYLSGLPDNLTQAVTTAVTLYLAGEPMLEKLDRIRLKYGMMEAS